MNVAERQPKPLNDCEKLSRLVAVSGAPSLRYIRIGRSLQKYETAANDEQRAKVGIERTSLSTRNEQQSAHAEERKAKDDTCAIAVTIDEPTGRDGHNEVT